ncbi:hypothetical protein Peur_008355 [Populus x canadensis]
MRSSVIFTVQQHKLIWAAAFRITYIIPGVPIGIWGRGCASISFWNIKMKYMLLLYH